MTHTKTILWTIVSFLFLALSIGSATANDLTVDLQNYYRLDGSDFSDEVHGEDITNTGTANVNGIINDGRDFDGTNNDNLQCNNCNSFARGASYNMSFQIWLNSDSWPGQTMLLCWDDTTHCDGYLDWFSNEIRWSGGTVKSGYTNTNGWLHLVVVVWANGTSEMYFNASVVSAGATQPNLATDDPLFGLRYDNNQDFNGQMDEIAFWNKSLNNTEVEKLFNSGAGLYYSNSNFSTPAPPAPAADYFLITARDEWNGTSIQSFSATVNGTTYYTSTGTINTTLNATAGGLVNITIFNATGYFNRSYTDYNSTNDLTTHLHQSELCLNTTEKISNNSLGGTITYYIGTNTTNYCFNITAATHSVIAERTHYYNVTQAVTTTGQTATNATIYNMYSNQLTIYAKSISGEDLSGYDVNITSLNYSAYSEAASSVTNHTFNVINGTYLVWINHPSYQVLNATIIANASLQNHTFILYDTNSFNITIYKETNNSILTGVNVTVEIIDSLNSYNYTTQNGTLYISNFQAGEITIRYDDDGALYEGRSYFLNISNQTHADLRLYLLNSTLSDLITLDLVDQDGADLEDAIIKAQRYYADENLYRTVAMTRSNFNGQGSIDLVKKSTQSNVFYRFIVEYEGVVRQSTEELEINPIGTDVLYFTINVLEDIFASYDGLDNVQYTLLYFNTSSPYFQFTWSDTSGLVRYGCLNVKEHTPLTETIICNNCTTSTAATILCNISDTGNTFIAAGLIETTTNNSLYTVAVESWSFDTKWISFGLFGVFLSFLFIGTLACIGLWNPIVAIVLTLVGLVFSAIIGLVNLSYVSLVALIIVGGIAIAKSRT